MSTDDFDPQDAARRDRREHGGAGLHPDDDALAERTQRERVEAGLADVDPDTVPPATDTGTTADITQTEVYRDEADESAKQETEGELRSLTEDRPFPPTSYSG